MKRLPFTDGFVDESVRGRRYLMACVMAEARHLPELRPVKRALAVHGRVHFNNESERRKRLVSGAIADMPFGVFINVAHRDHGISEFLVRNACLAAVVEHVQQRDVPRLVIESRDDDREDERDLAPAHRVRGGGRLPEALPGNVGKVATIAVLLADAATVIIASALLVVVFGSMVLAEALLLRGRSTAEEFDIPDQIRAVREPNARCPIRLAPVVVASRYMRPSAAGPMSAPRPRAELIGACVEHGRPPFNDMTARRCAANPASGRSDHGASSGPCRPADRALPGAFEVNEMGSAGRAMNDAEEDSSNVLATRASVP